MNNKLYIIFYIDIDNDNNNGFNHMTWQWAQDDNTARIQLYTEMKNKPKIVNTFIIPDAINKTDIINALQRYIIKPLNK